MKEKQSRAPNGTLKGSAREAGWASKAHFFPPREGTQAVPSMVTAARAASRYVKHRQRRPQDWDMCSVQSIASGPRGRGSTRRLDTDLKKERDREGCPPGSTPHHWHQPDPPSQRDTVPGSAAEVPQPCNGSGIGAGNAIKIN